MDYVFYRDECNFKIIIFEGTTEECVKYVKENGTYGEYALEIGSQR